MNKRVDFELFGTSAHPELMEELAQRLEIEHGRYRLESLLNFNSLPRLQTKVADRRVFIIHSFAPKPEIEGEFADFKKLIRAAREYGASEIIPIVTYFSYVRSHRRIPEGVPIAAKLYAEEIKNAGADKVVLIVLHNLDIERYFNVPVIHLGTKPLLINALKKFIGDKNTVLISPDLGRKARIGTFADAMHLSLACGEKKRESPTTVKIVDIHGEIKKRIIVVDDEINNGGTIESLCLYLLTNFPQVREIILAFTHGVLCGPAVARLSHISSIAKEQGVKIKIFITNTLPIPATKRIPNMKILSVAPMLKDVVDSINAGEEIKQKYLYREN